MNLLIWLDVPLLVFGLFAMSPGIWYASRLGRIGKRSARSRGLRTATDLLFSLGLIALIAAGVDAGLAEWDQVCRPRGGNPDEDNIRVSMMAPDFSLPSLDEDRTIRLSDFRGHKPVVLIFGNFT
jgi:hypothetical protein